MAAASAPMTSPPATALPWASPSASRTIPQPAVTTPSSTTAGSRTLTAARPVTDAARVNVAAEFPAPTDGQANVVARLKPTTPTAKMISPRAEPQAPIATTATIARITRLKTVPATPPSCTTAEVTSRHHCPC